MAAQLKNLRAIQGNLAKRVKDKNALKDELKDFFEYYLRQGKRRFQAKLRSESVSPLFRNTIASKRLYNSFNTDISKALRIGSDNSLRFSFGIVSSGRRDHNDPSQYYAAIDDSSRRRGGPSLERVIEWMKERGIVEPGRKTVTTRKGKRTNIRSFAFAVQTAIWKRTANREYRSLRISELLASIIDIKNPNSDFRETMRGRVSNLVLSRST